MTSGRRLRVLIADDSESIRRALGAFLRLEGIDVVSEAVNGAEAVTKAKELRPDVVLLDVVMPTMNGFIAARLIKKGAPSTRIIMVTQHNSAAFIREALSVGAYAYVLKENAARDLLPWLQGI